MALINAGSLGNLASVSVNVNSIKEPGKFFNVCITSERRGKMNGGYYQCPVSFEDNGNGDFFILNEDKVYFLPLYIKKYWVKYESVQGKDGKKFDSAVDFGWKDNSQKPDGAKYEYIIAGYLYDKSKSNIVTHPKDLDENGIKSGDPVLVYFRCKGLKCSGAYDLLNKINEKGNELPPLGDDPSYEHLITQRRFLIEATIVKKETQYRPFDIFHFEPVSKLPDELVVKIIEAANTKFMKDFDKQFDKTDIIASFKNKKQDNNTKTNISTSADHVDIPDVSEDSNPGDNFNIDI